MGLDRKHFRIRYLATGIKTCCNPRQGKGSTHPTSLALLLEHITIKRLFG